MEDHQDAWLPDYLARLAVCTRRSLQSELSIEVNA